MKFKKLLTASLMGLALISCGKKEEKVVSGGELKGKVVVQVEDAWKPYYDAAIKRVIEKNPKVEVELKVVPSFDHLEILDKTDASNEDVADLFAAPLDRITDLKSKESLASFDAKSLGDRIGGFGNYDEGLGGQLKFDDEYLGFPFNIETLVLGYNKENAKANGIDVEQVVDFAKLSPKVAMIPVFNAWWGVAITNAFDLKLLEKENDKFVSDLVKDYKDLTADQKMMFEGLYNYWKASHDSKLPMFDMNAVYGFMDDNFKNGKSGSVRVIGPWEVGAITENIKDNLDIKGLNHATWQGKELRHWKGGWALVINARNENDEVKVAILEEIIAELLNPEFAGDFFKITGKIMPNVSSEQYAALDIPELDKKVILSVLDSYKGAVARPTFKEWKGVWDTWQNALLSWEAKKPANAEEAYKEIQASFTALLENIK